jgi:hypothetical protein
MTFGNLHIHAYHIWSLNGRGLMRDRISLNVDSSA